MLERRCHKPLKPRADAPTKLQAKFRDNVIAEHLSKGPCACRTNQNPPKGVLGVHAAQEDSSATIVRLSQNQDP